MRSPEVLERKVNKTLQLLPPVRRLHMMTQTMRRRYDELIDGMPANKYSPGMMTQNEVKFTIMRPLIEALG